MPVPIQNLRSAVSNKRPVATGLAVGQIAVNYNEDDPAIYLRGNADALIKVSPTYVGTTAPNATPASGGASGNAKGETWLDTSTSPASFKVWNGSSWVAGYTLASGTTITSPILNNATASGGVYTAIAISGASTAPTQTVGTSGTSIATTAFVNAEIANDAALKDGTGATGTWNISVTGNAGTATTLQTARNITLSGAVSGSTAFNGSTNVVITTTVDAASHNHPISGVTGLQAALDAKVNASSGSLSGGTLSGTTTVASGGTLDVAAKYQSTINAVAASDINCNFGNYFTRTVNGAVTFTFSNAPASRAYSFTMEVTHTSGAITWPTSVKWPGDTAPTLTTGRTHLFIFVTDDGGSRWRGAALVDYVN